MAGVAHERTGQEEAGKKTVLQKTWRRVRQYFIYLTARVTAEDRLYVVRIAGPALAGLFFRLSPGEQVHSLAVTRWLEARGQNRPELLQAALLHDVGKIRAPVTLPERAVAVLAHWQLPRCYERWARGEPRGWKRTFVMAVHHPAWGADLVAGITSPGLVTQLIRRHQDEEVLPETEEDRLLLWIQRAETET